MEPYRSPADALLQLGWHAGDSSVTLHIRRATVADVEWVAPLFDAYRQFYGKAADPALAATFLRERLENGESVVLLALDDIGTIVGFTQLYPGFSSVRAGRIFLLNDLYVLPSARRGGVAAALLAEAAAVGRAAGAVRLTLVTARTNLAAQKVYEANGWVRDEQFFDYALTL